MRIWIEERGCIQSKWGLCSDGISRLLGDVSDPDAEIKKRAVKIVENNRKEKEIEDFIRATYPGKQIYQSYLPTYDVAWDGDNDWYMYVLKDRRKKGKYQILYAAKIEI